MDYTVARSPEMEVSSRYSWKASLRNQISDQEVEAFGCGRSRRGVVVFEQDFVDHLLPLTILAHL
jgi:hypothetical protein